MHITTESIPFATAVYFSTALERDYLYELINGDTGDGETAYVYRKGNTMYVTSRPSFLKQPISGSFPYEWEDSITRVVVVDEISPENMDNWFADMTKLKRIDGLENWNVESLRSVTSMFMDARKLEAIGNLNCWKLGESVHAYRAFDGCVSLCVSAPYWAE